MKKQQDTIKFEGNEYYSTKSKFQDIDTGELLNTWYRFDEEGNMIYLIENLDGTFELNY